MDKGRKCRMLCDRKKSYSTSISTENKEINRRTRAPKRDWLRASPSETKYDYISISRNVGFGRKEH